MTIALLLVLAQGPIKIACVGASITAGVGTHDASTQSYPAQLQRMLGDRYQVGNFGHSGATLARTGDVPYWTVPEFKAAERFAPNIVVIMLGTNDARSINWPKSKNVFVPQYKELIAHFRSLPTHPRVFACVPSPDFEERKATIDAAIVPLVKQAARESGADLIDFYTPLEGKGELFADGLHPNEQGAQLMAEAVAEAVDDPATRKRAWRVVSADSEEAGEGPARCAIDGDTYTYWHTNYSSKETRPPHEIVVDMGSQAAITGFRYLPRQDGGVNGRVRGFELYLSEDGKSWGSPAFTGEMKNSSMWTNVALAAPTKARFFRFRALSEWNNGPWTSVAELDVRRAIAP